MTTGNALLISLLATFSGGCGRAKPPPVPASGDLAGELQKYVALSATKVDTHGFDTDSPCDSLERSCFRYLGGAPVDYGAAEDPKDPGHWYRDSARSCGTGAGTSASGVSKDTLLGLAFCLWQAADVPRAEAVLAYADAHGGVMSPDGPTSLTSWGLVLPHLFKAVVAKAKSTPLPPDRPTADTNSPLTVGLLTGYQAHLAVVGVLLDGLIYGGLTPIEMQLVKDQAERQPRNALYQAVLHHFSDGDQSAALTVLSDESLFPVGGLPTSADRSTSYLWERDEPGADWSPSGEGKTFSGTDFIFAAALVTGRIRGE